MIFPITDSLGQFEFLLVWFPRFTCLELDKTIVVFFFISADAVDYGDLLIALKTAARKVNLKDADGFIHKCTQLYETTVVRHGLMIIGPTGSGKTKVCFYFSLFDDIANE